MKQKREEECEEKQNDDIDAQEDFNPNEDDNDSKGAESSCSKIKIHRKRSHHSECLENQPSTKQLTEVNGNDVEKSITTKDKKSSNNSFPDLLSVVEGADSSSPEKVKGPIARKLTFGNEVMNTPTKGYYRKL